MNRIALAALLTAILANVACAESVRETVARKYGEAIAIASRCPTLTTNTTWMSAYLAALGLSIDDADFKTLVEINHNRVLTELYDRSEADICAVGEMLYGPKGTNAPRLLKQE